MLGAGFQRREVGGVKQALRQIVIRVLVAREHVGLLGQNGCRTVLQLVRGLDAKHADRSPALKLCIVQPITSPFSTMIRI